jgi:hypothetical protein
MNRQARPALTAAGPADVLLLFQRSRGGADRLTG